MSCDICGRESCEPWFHCVEQQRRFEKVIEAFEKARQLRRKLNEELDAEALEAEEQEEAKARPGEGA